MPPLRFALFPFAATEDIRDNARRIAEAIEQAARHGAQVVLTPEAALTGYPGAARGDLEEVNWRAVSGLEDELGELALERGLILVLGSGGPFRDGISNDALVCGAIERERRYRKRCLTPHDRDHFLADDEPLVVEAQGWRLGLAICFDLRFPDVWADCSDADCFCCIAHLAGQDLDGVKRQILPCLCASRAAELATPLALCNTAAADRWLDSGCWDCRGIKSAEQGEGLALVEVRHRDEYDPWYRQIRALALERWAARRDD